MNFESLASPPTRLSVWPALLAFACMAAATAGTAGGTDADETGNGEGAYFVEEAASAVGDEVGLRLEASGGSFRLSSEGVEMRPSLTDSQGSGSIRISFLGANRVAPEGWDPALGRAQAFARVTYAGLYAGTDLVYEATPLGAKYEFQLAPGTDPSVIRLQVEGAALEIDAVGSLRLDSGAGTFIDTAPRSFQEGKEVACRFVLYSESEYGFTCAGVDPALPLVIDPLLYSTLLGGSDTDLVYAAAIDADGNAIVVGQTYSSDFPATAGAFDTTANGSGDAFVAKINLSANAIAWATYLGGSEADTASGVAVDEDGNVYVAGMTWSSNFTTTQGSFDPTYNGGYWYFGDAFLVKFNASGGLVFSTFIGGAADDAAYAVALGPRGDIFVAGVTLSSDFPATAGVHSETINGGWDTFVVRFAPNGSSVGYATFLGGSSTDWPAAIAVNASGFAFVTGWTDSNDYPTTFGAYNRTRAGGQDVFLAKLNETGARLAFATLIGGADDDLAVAIALTPDDKATVVGTTASADFPLSAGAFDRTFVASEAFVVQFDASGSALELSTFFGGGGDDVARAVAIGPEDDILFAGTTGATDLVTTAYAADRSHNGGTIDGFLARFNANASELEYSTFIGGWGYDQPNAMALSSIDQAVIAGYSSSSNFPTTAGAFDRSFAGWWDSFVSVFKTAYRITLDTSPAALKVQLDGSNRTTPYTFACVMGSPRRIGAPSPQIVDTSRYTFVSWTGDVGQFTTFACQADAVLTASYSTEFAVNLESAPSGLLVKVDGRSYFTPYLHWCAAGGNATLNVSSPQIVNGTRYTFLNWSDGGPPAHTVACAGPRWTRASFSTEYRVTVDTDPSGLLVGLEGVPTATPFSLWCPPGGRVNLSIVSPQEVSGVRYAFLLWFDSATTDRSITCNAPVFLTAAFHEVAYFIVLDTSPGGLLIGANNPPSPAPLSIWCRRGASLSVVVTTPQVLDRTRYRFQSWSAGLTGGPNQTVACDLPQSYSASFAPEAYRLDFRTQPGGLKLQLGGAVFDTPASYWCFADTSLVVNAPSPQVIQEERYLFSAWLDGRGQSRAAGCDGPLELVASFAVQHGLSVETHPAGRILSIDGFDYTAPVHQWCEPGSTHRVAVSSSQTTGDTRYVFESWNDGGTQDRTVACDAPVNLAALFRVEFTVLVATLPAGLDLIVDGVPAIAPQSYWWAFGSVHDIEVPSPQQRGDHTYAFVSWSDEGARAHAVTVSGPRELTATAQIAGVRDFSLVISRANLQVAPGGAQQFLLSTGSVNAYAGPPVTISAEGLPEGISAACDPPTVVPGETCTLEVAVAPSVPPGIYTLTLVADNGTAQRRLSVDLVVTSTQLISPPGPGGWVLPVALVLALAAGSLLLLPLARKRISPPERKKEKRAKAQPSSPAKRLPRSR